MTPLPVLSGQQAAKALERAGFLLQRRSGSHLILRRQDPFAQLVVPAHRVLDRGTLRAIIRQSGLTVEEFVGLLS